MQKTVGANIMIITKTKILLRSCLKFGLNIVVHRSGVQTY